VQNTSINLGTPAPVIAEKGQFEFNKSGTGRTGGKPRLRGRCFVLPTHLYVAYWHIADDVLEVR
jgi:hypothetical protein